MEIECDLPKQNLVFGYSLSMQSATLILQTINFGMYFWILSVVSFLSEWKKCFDTFAYVGCHRWQFSYFCSPFFVLFAPFSIAYDCNLCLIFLFSFRFGARFTVDGNNFHIIFFPHRIFVSCVWVLFIKFCAFTQKSIFKILCRSSILSFTDPQPEWRIAWKIA